MNACLSDNQFELLAAGDHDPGTATAEHLEQCSDCRERLEQHRQQREYLSDIRAAWTASSLGIDHSIHSSVPLGFDTYSSSDERERESIPGYDIIREIYRGGQGVVYEAVQHSTRRTVAVKVLLEGSFASDRARWRFEREVKLVAALKHPNIIIIHDSGIAHGRYFFAMDYVRGQPLDTHIRLSGPPLRSIIEMFREICDAVAYAHRRGVIHRDLKPSNILVTAEGWPCVLDFGLAKIISEDLEEANRLGLTVPGGLMGTLRYMSPEQTLGSGDAIDIRTDVYTLGVILYELLTGGPPYNTSTDLATALSNIREVDPPKPSRIRRDMNADLETVVLKAMAKEPERRYQSAGELADDLGAYLDGRPISAKSSSTLYVIRKLALRSLPETVGLIAVLLAIGAVGHIGVQALLHARRADDRAQQSDRAAVSANAGSNLLRDQSWKLSVNQSLGWFLLEWHAGRMERAAGIQAALPPNSTQYAAMGFLLNDSMTIDQLLSKSAPEERPLVYFAAGERAYKRGEKQTALQYFVQCMQTPGDGWMKGAVQARLDHLGVRTGEVQNSASAPGGKE